MSQCSNSHTLYSCYEFKKNNMDEHHDFIRLKRLCFGCLNKGHISKDCRRKLTCQKCEKPHPTVLHYDLKDVKGSRTQEGSETNSDQAVSNCSSVCHSINEQSSVTNSMILSVCLQHRQSPKGSRGVCPPG